MLCLGFHSKIFETRFLKLGNTLALTHLLRAYLLFFWTSKSLQGSAFLKDLQDLQTIFSQSSEHQILLLGSLRVALIFFVFSILVIEYFLFYIHCMVACFLSYGYSMNSYSGSKGRDIRD